MQARATIDSPILESSVLSESRIQGLRAWFSLAIASGIIITWVVSIGSLFVVDLKSFPLSGKILVLLWQTFLYTGLFVTAHDAMHGAVCPGNRRLNDAVGTLVLILYGLFSYQTLSQRHIQHHRFPASEADPDYSTRGFIGWYWTFMVRYWSWTRLIALVLIFPILHNLLGISESNLAWAWVYPSVLSSFHLFYFGTYLPHRRPDSGYRDEHRSITTPRPWVLSLLACYHFGYHREHHRFSNVPWWLLPTVYRQQLAEQTR